MMLCLMENSNGFLVSFGENLVGFGSASLKFEFLLILHESYLLRFGLFFALEFLKQIQDLIWNSSMKSEERCNYKFIMQLQWQSMLKVLGKFQKCQS